jgi:hypothetical protein
MISLEIFERVMEMIKMFSQTLIEQTVAGGLENHTHNISSSSKDQHPGIPNEDGAEEENDGIIEIVIGIAFRFGEGWGKTRTSSSLENSSSSSEKSPSGSCFTRTNLVFCSSTAEETNKYQTIKIVCKNGKEKNLLGASCNTGG